MLPDNLKLITELTTRLKDAETRIERLETLEFMNITDNSGCIAWVDFDDGTDAIKTVSFPGPTGSVYPYSHATIIWQLRGTTSGAIRNLLMTFDAVAASYHQAYKYTKGGALTQVGLDNQSEWFVGRIGNNASEHAYGRITVPLYSPLHWPVAFGEWVNYESGGGVDAKQEKGDWGGHNSAGQPHMTDFNFFASAGNIVGEIYLYGWCPRQDNTGPID